MTKLYDLCVSTRKYKDKDGSEKTVWENVGAILTNEDGKTYMMLKAHFNPAGITRKDGSESIVVSMFPPKNTNNDYRAFIWTEVKGSKLYDMCVSPRRYKHNGHEKSVWENVGAVIMGEKTPYMMLKAHFNPAAIQRKDGSESIIVSLFKPKRRDESPNQDFDSPFSDELPSYPQSFDADSFDPNIPF